MLGSRFRGRHANETTPNAASVSKQAAATSPDHAARRITVEQENRIRQLEAEIRDKDALILSLRQAATNRPADSSRIQRRQQAWLDDLKQNNPQQYDEIMKRREQIRQDIQTSYAEKEIYFSSGGSAGTSEQEQAENQRIAQLLDEAWRLNDQMRNGNLPSNERQAVAQAMQQNRSELGPLLDNARARAWNNLGVQLGYNNDDAQALGDYINKIIDLTSMQSIYRSMRMGNDPRMMQNTPSSIP